MSAAGNWFRHIGRKIKKGFGKVAALGLPMPDPVTQAGETAKQGLSNRLPVESDVADPKDARPAEPYDGVNS